MTRLMPALAAALWLSIVSGALAGKVPPGEKWIPVSSDAGGVTGTIYVSKERITFNNGAVLRLQYFTEVPDFIDQLGDKVTAKVYKVLNPKNPKLRWGQYLCSGDLKTVIKSVFIWPNRKYGALIAPHTIEPHATDDIPHAEYGAGSCGAFTYDIE